MDKRANASDAGRQCAYRRIRSHSIHRTRAASSDRRGSRMMSAAAPYDLYREALACAADCFRCLPGTLTAALNVEREEPANGHRES
jgi:hypothetical protein